MEGQQQIEDIQIEYSPTKEEIIEYAKYLGMDIQKDQRYLYIAEEGLRAPLPEGWKEYITQEGEIYYFNQEKQMSQWEHPSDEFYKQKFMEQKNKDQLATQSLQDFVENDISNQNTQFIQEQQQKQVQKNVVKNSPITSESNVLQKNINQLKIQSPININQAQMLGRQTPKQEYYEYVNQAELKINEYQQKKSNELNEQIVNLENIFQEKKKQLKQQIDSQLQTFINAWDETNAKSLIENKTEEEINVQSEKEKILQQLQINFNEQKIIQENKLNQQFKELKEQIQQRIERKYQIQIDMLEAEKKDFDDINQNKSFLNISQRNINNTLVQEQQKMKQYYQEQIQRFKDQGQENLKYAIQDYKGNLNIQLQQKRQQKLREMKEKIDLANEQKKDKIRKEIQAEFELKKFELKKQYVVEEKALEQQERIKIEAEYSNEVSKLELKYIEDLQKLKQSEEMYYLKKQDRLLKIQNEIQQKYEMQEKELVAKLERKIQKLEDEQLDLQSKLNTKKIYSKKYAELKNLELQLNDNIKQQNEQIKLTQEQIESDKENISGFQNQIQEKLQEYQKLLQEQNQFNIPSSQNIYAQERREQQLIDKVSKLKDDFTQIQSDQFNANNYTISQENDILKNRDINLIKKGTFVIKNNENEQNSTLSKEKEQLQHLKKVIEQKLDEIHRPQVDNYLSIPKQTPSNNEDESFIRKRHSQFESSQFQQQKRFSSYDRAYQTQSQQGFYQDSRRQDMQFQTSKEDQISQLKQQLEQIKNQVMANEQKRKNFQKQTPPLIPSHNLKNRELSLDDFTNKRIITPSHQGTIQFNKFGETSRINSHNQSVQSFKAANNQNQSPFYQLKKDWKTIMSLEFEKLKLESDGVKKDKEILSHQIQTTKEEIKSLKRGQNEFLLHDLSKNIQNTVKNAEKVLKQKLIGQENHKISLQKKELELNQKKRMLDNIQIKLETMNHSDEEDEIESMYEEYKQLSREEHQKYSTSINSFNYESQQTYQAQRKQYQQEQSYLNRQKNKYQKFAHQNGQSFQEYELDEQEEEGITQQSDQDQLEHHSSWEDNNEDDFKHANQSFQQRIISAKYQSLQPPNKYSKIGQEVYIQGKMKHYQDLLSKYTIN
ncbi:WW domain protein (macronuclear) [Tetrahymena thermophila SB210]|uniref:WW domain protein n=1 Tax=Tetrahymena thermophila (strain SB210) TaxID=312017 RepID=I7MCQ4_TETTS|nr:WW domain protein [Tetrahymena thermophila SB210]EAR84626.2 WW domain protein [Tetrahymena thermophila SB210]|eukprot:XP_001032289.2 WW domain protein [Tetrahymena thermophila SB210]